jgi:thioredoxin-dependent peroxiredoxin
MIEAGQPAPEFDAPTAAGTRLTLRTLKGHPLVLYFYPEADTPGCTVESKGFRDHYADFRAQGVEIVGVSVDEVEDQKAFAGKYNLPFPLLADSTKTVATAYGVLGPGGKARRVTFLIDPQGKVVEVVANGKADPHIAAARARFLTAK